MKKTPIFQGIEESEKKSLLNSLQSTILNFTKNKTITPLTSNTDLIGIIEEGTADLVRFDYDGNKTIIESLEKNDIFSELFISNENSELTLIANTDCKIIFISYQNIIKLLGKANQNQQKLIKNIFTIVKEKIIFQNKRIEILTKRTTREKLLAYFSMLSKENMSRTFNLPFSYSSLADYLSINRSAMTREIKNLKDDGLIKEINKKITILY